MEGVISSWRVIPPMEGPMAINIARWKFVAALSGTAIARPLSPPIRNGPRCRNYV